MQDNDEPRSFAKVGVLLLPIIGTPLNRCTVQVSFGLIHEIKHDCYRIILDRDSKRLRLFTPTV